MRNPPIRQTRQNAFGGLYFLGLFYWREKNPPNTPYYNMADVLAEESAIRHTTIRLAGLADCGGAPHET